MIHARKDYTSRIVDVENKIPHNEPVFLIRAQDPAARAALEAWCKKTRELGGKELADHIQYNLIPEMDKWDKKKVVADCDNSLFTDFDELRKIEEMRKQPLRTIDDKGVRKKHYSTLFQFN